MATEQFIWTALPNGVSATGRLRLSVLVTPRLGAGDPSPASVLGPYTRFRRWPDQAVSFSVQFGAGTPVAADVVSPAPSLARWEALVGDDTAVTPFSFRSFDDAIIPSYPVAQVRELLQRRYGRILQNSPTEHPTPYGLFLGQVCITIGHSAQLCLPESDPLYEVESDGVPLLDDLLYGEGNQGDLPTRERFKRDLEAGLADDRVVVAERAQPSAARVLAQAEWFHERNGSGAPAPGPTDPPVPPPPVPELDIHQIVSLLGDYPSVVRQVGLLIDLEVDLPPGTPEETTVRVVPDWARDQPDITPATRALVGASTFLPAPRVVAPLLEAGFLRLGFEDFDLIELDTDGAALKFIDFIERRQALVPAVEDRFEFSDGVPTLRPADGIPVPSLRASGLSLSHLDRAVVLRDATSRNAEIDAAGSAAELDAEDLTTGYVVDVWDEGAQRWFQLCARQGTITYTNTDEVVMTSDEGAVSLGATRPPDADLRILCLHESLFRWMGWSLVAPRPGRHAKADPPGEVSEPDDPPEPSEAPPIPLEAIYRAAPGTLPRLRFGGTYRFRCRALDLAGHAVAFDQAGPPVEPLASVERTYGRLEPIESPPVLLRAPTTEAESVERLVLRSNFDAAPGPSPERHFVPPKVSEEMVEWCGAVDLPDGRLDRSRYDLLAQLDAGMLSPGSGTDPGTGERYFSEAAMALPYAPDPMARGVTFLGLPGVAPDEDGFAVPFEVAFGTGGTWPDARPFRLVMVTGTGTPNFDGGSQVLRVALAPGLTRRVRYSCNLFEADLDKLTLALWGITIGTARAAVEGRVWMFTPYRELTLVHATRQPVSPPRFGTLSVAKSVGATSATLTEEGMELHAPSTVRIDVEADWQEPIDALGEERFRIVDGSAKVGRVPVEESFDPDGAGTPFPFSVDHVFADTKHRQVRYRALATSRYSEYFRQRTTVALTATTQEIAGGAGILIGSEVVTDVTPPPPPDPPPPPPGGLRPPPVPLATVATYRRDADYAVDYAAGALRRLEGSAIGAGATVAVSFVPNPATRSSDEVELPARLVSIPSSARPLAASAVQVVPTFGWSRTESATRTTSQRSGGGLRVYLERPWFSSGEGEQLGVVLATPGTSAADLETLAPYVTRWGNDPVWLSGSFNAAPVAADFLRAVDPPLDPVPLAERPGVRVSVAPHEVAYDDDRRLWFCDIDLAPRSSYFPFLRMALARYQRASVTGVELSTVVLADFAQLAPDRSATVVFDPLDRHRLRLRVSGQTYRWRDLGQPGGRVDGPARVVVSLETRVAGIDGELGWEPAKGRNEFVLSALVLATGKPVTWTGDVILPNARGTKPFRLVIREYEQFRTVAGGPADAGRLVYVDVLEV
jgi:hypothetical protein